MTACTGKSEHRRDDIHTDDHRQYMAFPPDDCLRSDFKVELALQKIICWRQPQDIESIAAEDSYSICPSSVLLTTVLRGTTGSFL